MDGALPTLSVIDEYHRAHSSELYGLLRDGCVGRGGQQVCISTAGDDLDSPLGRLRAKAYAMPGMVRDGAYRHVRTPDFALHEFALDESEDRDDLEVVKTANPAPWLTIEELRKRRDSPSTTPWQFARWTCGVWLSGEDAAIQAGEWRACADPDVVIPDSARDVVVGIDLGWRRDCTAIVPVWRPSRDEPVVVGTPVIIEPPGDGSATEQHRIFDPCRTMSERWRDVTFTLDPAAGGEALAQPRHGSASIRGLRDA
jgi:phage terminase large subunit-like protein